MPELYSSDGTSSITVETKDKVSFILIRMSDTTLSFETTFKLMQLFCHKILNEGLGRNVCLDCIYYKFRKKWFCKKKLTSDSCNSYEKRKLRVL